MEAVNTRATMSLDTFENVFKDNYSPLFRYVNAIVRDQDQAKDVISDLFLNLWQQREKLEISNIKSYLFRSARNGALKALSQRNQTIEHPDLFNIPADSFNPFERFAAKESIRIVEALINKLSVRRKEMIELRLIGLKNNEIAKVLDIPEKTVEYNMREAIEQLTHFVNHSNLDKATIAGGLMMITLICSVV